MIGKRTPFRFMGFFFLFVSNGHLFSQDLTILPAPFDRSGIFVEGGLFQPFKNSWKNPNSDFTYTTFKDVHFRVGYDRFFLRRELFLRVAFTRREIDVLWSLGNLSKNPAPANPPGTFALTGEMGITETSLGLGYSFGRNGLYFRPALNLGLVSQGKEEFDTQIGYSDPSTPPDASIKVDQPRFLNNDLSVCLGMDLQAGVNIKGKHEIGLSFNYTRYGLRADRFGFSTVLPSVSTFTMENQEYIIRTDIFLHGYSFGLHYRYRFNMR